MLSWQGHFRLIFCKASVRSRSFVAHHNTIAQTPPYGLAISAAFAAWSEGGDMTLIAPVLFIGWLFACIGISLNKNIIKSSALVLYGLLTIPFVLEGIFLHFHFNKSESLPNITQASAMRPKTFLQVFETDFPAFGFIENNEELIDQKGNVREVVPTKIYFSNETNTKFMAIFLPEGDLNADFRVCRFYALHIDEILKMDSNGGLKFEIQKRRAGDSEAISTTQATFSKIIYIYAIPEMDLQTKAQIVHLFQQEGVIAIFRGIEYYSRNAL